MSQCHQIVNMTGSAVAFRRESSVLGVDSSSPRSIIIEEAPSPQILVTETEPWIDAATEAEVVNATTSATLGVSPSALSHNHEHLSLVVESSQTLASLSGNVFSTYQATSMLSPAPTSPLQQCPAIPPNLVGELNVTFVKKSFMELESVHSELGSDCGGHWRPPHCISRYKVAMILPYRDRHEQLQMFLTHMHPFLQKQELDYRIYVIDQAKGSLFNRAMLMNIGYMESIKDYDWECFIFHDVDLLPENDQNIYSCPAQPRHMSLAIDVFGYKLPYNDIFGGVSALTREQFEKVNGFSNSFWGWGGEDDDLANRVKKRGKYHITRYKPEIGRYKMIKHGHEASNKANPKRFNLLYQGYKRFAVDGINSLKYNVLLRENKQLYTWIYVNITKPPGL